MNYADIDSELAGATRTVADMVVDQFQITDLFYGYAHAVDTSDWPLFVSLFTETIELDFLAVNDQPAGPVLVADWMNYLASLRSVLIATQHFVTNPRVCVQGDLASATANVRGEHVLQSGGSRSLYTMGARYRDTFVRTSDGWRFQRIAVDLIWDDGDRVGMQQARVQASQALAG